MRYNLLLMIISILFITLGYANQVSPGCNDDVEIRYVPMKIYDELLLDKPYF